MRLHPWFLSMPLALACAAPPPLPDADSPSAPLRAAIVRTEAKLFASEYAKSGPTARQATEDYLAGLVGAAFDLAEDASLLAEPTFASDDGLVGRPGLVIGGTNIQFAHDPGTGRVVVIEINPRTSRSSALASKATGFPIAYVSSLLAGGLTLDEIPYWREGTLEKYTPWGDYVVVKFARWDFEKFPGAEDKLGTQMRAVGEVMSIGKTYKEALQKSIRSLEKGRYGLGFVKDFHKKTLEELMDLLYEPSSERQFIMYEALRKGASIEALSEKTYIKKWFIEQMAALV